MADAPAPTNPTDDILASQIVPAPSAPTEFVSAGYRFEHHPDGPHAGVLALAHPGCPRLTVAYGHPCPDECYSLEQAIQLILHVYQKEYSGTGGSPR